jgi:transposase
MSIDLTNFGDVYIVCGRTDLRKGIDSLASLIQEQFELNPFSHSVFLFCGVRNDRFKALHWDGEGFWLLYKRFENGKLTWPRDKVEVKQLSSEQLNWLMRGFSITPRVKPLDSLPSLY